MDKPTASNNVKRRTEIGEEALGKDVLCIIFTHIDDIKGSGDKVMQDSLLAALKNDYGGDVKIEVGVFVHTGIMHEQNPKDLCGVHSSESICEGDHRDFAHKHRHI